MRLLSVVLGIVGLAANCLAAEPLTTTPAGAAVADQTNSETQWKLKIKVCQGDLKLREQDPVFKMLSAPQVVTVNGSPFTVQVGQAVPTPKVPNVKQQLADFGIKFQGNIQQLDEQTVQLDLSFQNAELVTGKPDEVEIKSTGVRSIKQVKIGETTTISLGKNEGQQGWVEVTVEEVEK